MMATWKVDGAHTNVGFSVKHMMVSKVRGEFQKVEGALEGDPENLANGKLSFKIDVTSINTGNNDRDNHLRSDDFFDAESHPHITFNSTEIAETGKDEYDVIGDVTIKGITKPLTFKVTYNGSGKNPWGVDVAAFDAESKLSRKEFGLTWNQTLETGGVLVGDDINITLEVQVNPEG